MPTREDRSGWFLRQKFPSKERAEILLHTIIRYGGSRSSYRIVKSGKTQWALLEKDPRGRLADSMSNSSGPAAIRAQVRRLPTGEVQLKIPLKRGENPSTMASQLKRLLGKRVKKIEVMDGKRGKAHNPNDKAYILTGPGSGYTQSVRADSLHAAALQAKTGTLGNKILVDERDGPGHGEFRVVQTMKGTRVYRVSVIPKKRGKAHNPSSVHKKKYSWGDLWIKVDLAQASAPILYGYEGDDWRHSPFQTANARHSLARAFSLVNQWLKSQSG